MTQIFNVHPDNPQQRLIRQAAQILQNGGVIVYPTDSSYALACQLNAKQALTRIQKIRQLDQKHNFTLVCASLVEIGQYAKVDNLSFRFIKSHTPGPYTFILKASSIVPRRLTQVKRKTVGLRIPDHAIAISLAETLAEPFISTTLALPHDEVGDHDGTPVWDTAINKVDAIINDDVFHNQRLTTVVDLTTSYPVLVREGCGTIDWL